MESFLKRIENYLNENNINYERFACSVESLPEAFKREIKAIFQKTTDEFVGPVKTWINFSYDEDDNLYMFIGNRCNRGKIIVYQDGHCPDAYAERISESEFIEGASCEEESRLRLEVEKKPILSKYLSKYLAYVNVRASVLKEADEFADLMCDYLEWMKEYEQEDIIELLYIEPEKSTSERTMKVSAKSYKDRIHEVLENDERVKVLDRFSPKYRFRATSDSGSKIYNVRVYQPQSTSYRIIMDPEIGKGHIKISYQESETALSEGEISGKCIELLQMSRDAITDDPTMTRHQHRNIEEYENLVSYVVTGEGKINATTKKHIDSAKEAAVLQKRK